MKDVYTIQEFSQLSGVEASTLRYWDDIGLFSPIKRNPENNYRYYSLAQLVALNFVTVLSELDIPLKTIAELKSDRNPVQFIRLLDKHEKELDMQMRRLRMRYSIIHARRELINYGMRADENEISVRYREDMTLKIWPEYEYKSGDTFIDALASFVHRAGDLRINLSFPVGGYFDSLEDVVNRPDRPQRFFTIDPVGLDTRKEGDYLIGFVRGYFAEMGDLPQRMADYAKKNRVVLAGPVYAIYLLDELCEQNSNEFLLQLCAAVENHV